MKERYKFVILGSLIFILLFGLFPLAIFKFGLGRLIYNLFFLKNINNELYFQVAGLVIMIVLSSIFGLAGYGFAKRKRLNIAFWTTMCVFFNFWGYVILRIVSKKLKKNRLK